MTRTSPRNHLNTDPRMYQRFLLINLVCDQMNPIFDDAMFDELPHGVMAVYAYLMGGEL